MDNKAFEKKVDQDVDQAINDFATLGNDGVTGLNRMIVRGAEDAKKMVDDTMKTVNKTVGQGLSQYNTKLQDVADSVPGDFAKKAARYPWVTITISLAIGLLIGGLLKPGRQPVG